MKKLRNYGVCILFLCFSPSFAQAADGYLVQLGSFRSEDAARKDWTRIREQQKDLLATMTSSFQRADLGSKGVFFRLHAGPLASKSAAKNICAELTKRKVGCLVIKPYEIIKLYENSNNISKNPNTLEDLKSAFEKLKKYNELNKARLDKVKPYNLSVTTGYSDSHENEKGNDIIGKTLSISISRKLSPIEQVYGFGFGSTARTETSDIKFDAKHWGLGLGYSTRSVGGITLGGNVVYSHSSSDTVPLTAAFGDPLSQAQWYPESSPHSYSLSVNASKAYPLSGGYTAMPLLNLQYSYSRQSKHSKILSPKLNLSKIFSGNWLGSASVGGNFSDQAITLSGRKKSLEVGFGVGYFLPNQVLLKADYKRQQSSGYHSDSASLSTSFPF